MRRTAPIALLAALAAITLAPPTAAESKKAGGLTFATSPAVSRGKYLVSIMGCNDCHTPWKMGAKGPEPDVSLYLSGHPEKAKLPPAPAFDPKNPWAWHGAVTNTAFAGPWGVSYAINLTSDPATGIGSWTEENFVKALKEGKHLGVGRPILPPMPWPAYRNASDEDLRAVYAYLKTVPAVKNQAPESQAAPPPAR